MFIAKTLFISAKAKDYITQYQDLQRIGMTSTLSLPTLIALCSIAIQKPTVSSLAILGEISVKWYCIKGRKPGKYFTSMFGFWCKESVITNHFDR